MGGGKESTTQTTKVEIPKEIRQRGTAITTGAMNTYFDPAAKYENYNYGNYSGVGQATTGQLNNYHQTAANGINDAQSSYQPFINRADQTATQGNANNQASQVNGPNYNYGNIAQYMNPYTQGVINQGLSDIGRATNTQRLENQSRAAGAGAFGGARHGVVDAEGQRTAADTAQRFITENLNTGFNQAVNQYNTNFGQDLAATAQNNAAKGQNYNQAASLSQILANLGQQQQSQQLDGSKAALDYGNVVTAQEQAQKDNAYNKGYLDKRDRPLDIYERLSGINAMQPVNRTSTTNTTSSSSGGWLGPVIGAGGSILAGMSDERSKEDIQPIDAEDVLEAFAKIEPKTYRYKEDFLNKYPSLTVPGPRTGFMAQDVERAFKTPSGPTVNGLKTVDLSEMVGRLTTAVHGLEKRTRAFAAPRRRG